MLALLGIGDAWRTGTCCPYPSYFKRYISNPQNALLLRRITGIAAVDTGNMESLALDIGLTRFSRRLSLCSVVINWLGMWRFVAAGVLATILLLAAIQVLLQRRTKRQNRSMRDHLNRIARTDE